MLINFESLTEPRTTATESTVKTHEIALFKRQAAAGMWGYSRRDHLMAEKEFRTQEVTLPILEPLLPLKKLIQPLPRGRQKGYNTVWSRERIEALRTLVAQGLRGMQIVERMHAECGWKPDYQQVKNGIHLYARDVARRVRKGKRIGFKAAKNNEGRV